MRLGEYNERVLVVLDIREPIPTLNSDTVQCYHITGKPKTNKFFCSCPLKENGANTTIIESEIAHYATFESGIFKFDQSDTVYLHCHVRVCFQECDIDCAGTVAKTASL